MLNWAKQFNIFCFLDNCGYAFPPPRYECLLAAGASEVLHAGRHPLSELDRSRGWWFGHLSYECMHATFGVDPNRPDPIGFPLFYFFRPKVLVSITGSRLSIEADQPADIYRDIINCPDQDRPAEAIVLQQRFSRDAYMETVRRLQEHMQRGDCYELNFCQEFFAQNAVIDPVTVFKRLSSLSANPFSALYRLDDRFLICASPERFLKREGDQVMAQPIKGTAARSSNAAEDEQVKQQLRTSAKEQAENIMVVDLLRNDLSKVCRKGSVMVDELMGLYSFPQVHQLVSTIRGTLATDSFSAIMEAVFPMGSMTGAPKKRVVELIQRYEPVARGIFSGSVGYIDPDGNFDYNVVIRSILYQAASRYLSCQVGSGITIYSDAAAEWEECLLKAAAIKKVLAG